MHPLDNPTWAALTTYQSDVALVAPQARRFPPEMTVHGAFAKPTPEAWNDLRSLADAPVSLFSMSKPELPSGCTITRAVELHLMLCEQPGSEKEFAGRDRAIVDLVAEDLPQMKALYEATRPERKLSPRLIELGGFVGIKDNDRVLAMACLRLHFRGYREISTVATLPGHTGRGYATAVVGELVRRIRSAGETPYLTVRTDNDRAIGIYRRLGFRERNVVYSTTVKWA